MSWIALRITPASNREGVIAALFEAGSQGVQEDGACVVTHFPAAKLGAARVVAIEIDQDAIENAEENVSAKIVEERVEVIEGDAATLLQLLAPVRVVLANIISSVLIQLLPMIRASLAPGGQAILAGILWEEREAMIAALDADGWVIEREDREDAWWSVQIALR